MLNGEIREFEVNKELRPVPGRFIFYNSKIWYATDSKGSDREFKLFLKRGDEIIDLPSDHIKAHCRVVINHEGIIEL